MIIDNLPIIIPANDNLKPGDQSNIVSNEKNAEEDIIKSLFNYLMHSKTNFNIEGNS